MLKNCARAPWRLRLNSHVSACHLVHAGESDAVSGVTLGLLVFPPVDGGDDLVAPSPPMMAHLLSLGTQSEDAAEAPQSSPPPPLPPADWDVLPPSPVFFLQ